MICFLFIIFLYERKEDPFYFWRRAADDPAAPQQHQTPRHPHSEAKRGRVRAGDPQIDGEYNGDRRTNRMLLTEEGLRLMICIYIPFILDNLTRSDCYNHIDLAIEDHQPCWLQIREVELKIAIYKYDISSFIVCWAMMGFKLSVDSRCSFECFSTASYLQPPHKDDCAFRQKTKRSIWLWTLPWSLLFWAVIAWNLYILLYSKKLCFLRFE